jgi:hypothetical protein
MMPQMPFSPFGPLFNPYMAPFQFPMAMQGQQQQQPFLFGQHSPTKARERSSSPIDISGNVHDFCQAYGIGEEEELGLEKLGFALGDNLDEVEEREYQAAGFKTLAWKRVLKAYKKWKRDNKN